MTKYQLVEDIDLTRHVRTARGVAYFHKPIGAPIGKGGGTAEKIVPRGRTFTTSTPRAASMSAAPRPAKMAVASRPAPKTKSNDGSYASIMSAINGLPVAEQKKHRAAVRKGVRADRGAEERRIGSQWAELDDKNLKAVIENPDLSPSVRREARAEMSLRVLDEKFFDHTLSKAAEEAKAAAADPEKKTEPASAFQKAMIRLAPRTSLALMHLSQKVSKHVKAEAKAHKETAKDEARKVVVRSVFLGVGLTAMSLLTGHPAPHEILDTIKEAFGEFAS